MNFDLSPEEQAQFEDWVNHQREITLRGMAESEMVVSIMEEGDVDVQQALELGMCMLLGKPLLIVCQPGAASDIDNRLFKIADEIVYADVDTAEGMKKIRDAIERISDER